MLLRFFMKFPDYLRAGTNVGVRFVAACNHLPEVGSQSKQEFDGRISLQAKDGSGSVQRLLGWIPCCLAKSERYRTIAAT